MSIVFYGICIVMTGLVGSSLWHAFWVDTNKKATTIAVIAFSLLLVWGCYLLLGNPQMIELAGA